MRWLQQLKQRAKRLKKEVQVLAVAYKDKRTPVAAKILIGITVAYLFSPIDLIPDFIPVLGLLDDLIIVPLLIAVSLKMIPPVVLDDARVAMHFNAVSLKKEGWLAAVCIILIWILILSFIYRHLTHQ